MCSNRPVFSRFSFLNIDELHIVSNVVPVAIPPIQSAICQFERTSHWPAQSRDGVQSLLLETPAPPEHSSPTGSCRQCSFSYPAVCLLRIVSASLLWEDSVQLSNTPRGVYCCLQAPSQVALGVKSLTKLVVDVSATWRMVVRLPRLQLPPRYVGGSPSAAIGHLWIERILRGPGMPIGRRSVSLRPVCPRSSVRGSAAVGA